MITKAAIMMMMVASCMCAVAQTFQHNPGQMRSSLTIINGHQMQDVHEYRQVIYAKPGQQIKLRRPDYQTYISYCRWIDYATDQRPAYTFTASGASYDTEDGIFFINKKSENIAEITLPDDFSVITIACEQSIYMDYTANSSTIQEPTLSQRYLYEIHNANEIAARVDNATGYTWLETHEMIAPTDNQLYIGPNFAFANGATYPSYHYNSDAPVAMKVSRSIRKNTNIATSYQDKDGNECEEDSAHTKIVSTTHSCSRPVGWIWTMDGVAQPMPTISSSRFLKVKSTEVGLIQYTLQYNTSVQTYDSIVVATFSRNDSTNQWQQDTTVSHTGAVSTESRTIYNIAKFNVNYKDINEVGPAVNLDESNRLNSATEVARQDFNFTGEYTTYGGANYYSKPFSSAESSYGFALGGSSTRPSSQTKYQKVYWGEYAFMNNTKGVSWYNQSKPLYNHGGGEGYLLFVDGSEAPGEVLNIHFNANLCPGSMMYFSAYVGNMGEAKPDITEPNLDFILTGIDGAGKEHILTTYTTGEFGTATKAQWMRILFPFTFSNNIDYVSYHLKVTDKGKGADGNDFVIDDVQIFSQKPPVVPIQASTKSCPENGEMHTAAYLRIDYQAIEGHGQGYYYQWRDHNNQPIDGLEYLGPHSEDGYGYVDILDDEDIEDDMISESLIEFDNDYSETTEPVVRYIKENIAGVERYILYIAQPITLRPNYVYTGYLAAEAKDLGSREGCGTFADMLVSGGIVVNLNGEVVSNGEPHMICSSESNTLKVLYRFVAQNATTGELQTKNVDCRADWLYGSAQYIDEHSSIYGGDFAAVSAAILACQADTATEEQQEMVRMLAQCGLLTLNTQDFDILLMGEDKTITYVVFPIAGSAPGQDICATPATVTLTLPDDMNVVMLGKRGEDSDLPEFIRLNPHRVRIGEKTMTAGSSAFNIYLQSDDAERSYSCSSATLIGKTYTGSATLPTTIGIVPTQNGEDVDYIDQNTDGLRMTGLESLIAGYDYTFRLETTIHNGTIDDPCTEGYCYFRLRVVPAEVTWLPRAANTAWNNDANWSSFVPLGETNVILLADRDYIVNGKVAMSDDKAQASTYAEFEEGAQTYITYDINYEPTTCANLHLPVGGALVGQERIDIREQVFFDLATVGDQWTMCGFPIKGVVSGDIFTPVNESASLFEAAAISQTTDLVASDRTTYQYYISLFNQNVQLVGKGSTVQSTTWSTASNALDTRYAEGQGISIGADFASDQIIRLPKQDDTYKYYQGGAWVDAHKTSISRDADYGKPIYPYGADSKELTLTNNADGKIFLFGNPTLGYLDMNKLIAGNSGVLANSYAVYGADASKRSAIVQVSGGISTDGLDHHLLAPGRAVLLTAKASGKSLTLTITPEMIVTSDGEHGKSSAPRRRMMQSAEDKSIYISARYGEGFLSYAVLTEDADAQDEMLDNEDTEALLLDKSKTRMAIFTTADSKSLAINRIQSTTVVPLCLYAQKSCAQETVTFRGDESYLGEWDLVSLTDGSRTQLYDSLSLTLSMPQDGTCAYTLEHSRMGAPSIVTATDDIADAIHCYGTHGQLLVYSNTMLGDISIYDASGRLVADAQDAAETASFTLPCGIYVVRAQGQVMKTTVR